MHLGIRELIFFALLLAFPLGAYFSVFRPHNERIAEAREEIRYKEQRLAELEAATENITSLGAEIDRLAEAIELFEQKLPAQREVEVILRQVWELAAQHGLTPESVRTDQIVPAAEHAELPIKMVILGDFDGFYSFLLDLEKLPRITRLPQMELRADRERSDGVMRADIVLSIFFDRADAGGRSGSGARGRRGGPGSS
ncbi:MAG: type 4a pilus biogenesis protein PilO [Phycisphaeraceae bacterium]